MLPGVVRIRSLRMENFRGFEDETIDLDRPLTVLVGGNGAGKSSVLDAVVYIHSEVLRHFQYGQEWDLLRLLHEDIRMGAEDTRLLARLTHEGHDAEWSIDRPRDTRRWTVPQSLESLKWRGTRLRLAVVYGATRSVARSETAFQSGERTENHPYEELFQDWISAPRTGFSSFFRWFKAREDVENEEKVAREELTFQDPQLDAVRRAVTSMIPGFSGLRVQRAPLHLMVRKGGVALYIDQLSEGERNLLVMVADLARRLAITNPDMADALLGEAIVLIDEIELHLHPAWQRRVLPSLRRTFPNCQFVVTTHSPQVISEVPNDAVVLLQDFKFSPPPTPTSGRDSNAILEQVMGVPERPEEVARAFDEVRDLIDDERFEEARARLEALRERVTEHDGEWLQLSTRVHVLEHFDAPDHQGA
jgi:predicted ATP-binding protein involved in virulence